jgi:hypothetical protein
MESSTSPEPRWHLGAELATRLPAQLIHTAAQFASSDPANWFITGILVRPAECGVGIRIDSSDGRRAFRVYCPGERWFCLEPILLKASAFKKRIPNARTLDILNEEYARITGGKKRDNDEIMSLNATANWLWGGERDIISSATCNPASLYPNVDYIWPSSYGNNCEEPITFDAQLCADFLKEVCRFSQSKRVTMQRNGQINPLMLTAEADDGYGAQVEMNFLLMPIGRPAQQVERVTPADACANPIKMPAEQREVKFTR